MEKRTGKRLDKWIGHPAMGMTLEQRELMMMLYRDLCDIAERYTGHHVAEKALVQAGYAEVDGDVVRISKKGIKFWEGFVLARGEVVLRQIRREGTHNKRGRNDEDNYFHQ